MKKLSLIEILIAKKYRFYRHFLLITLISVILFNSGPEVAAPAMTLVLFLLLFYINMMVLVPKLLFKNKYALYFLCITGIIAGSIKIYFLGRYFFDSIPAEEEINIPLFIALVVVLIAASSSVKLFQKLIADKQRIFELEKANISTELEQLKNQINPHFLFNMLNNANVLTKKDPDKASQVLVKLSELLRYQLYDSTREKVLLTADIRFIEDFLDLEKVRRDNFDYVISKEGDLSGIQVPPLLFISFVENAVKHNNDTSTNSFVNLHFYVRGNSFIFKCINSKPQIRAITRHGGLGLVNIKRRLALLFPESHKLEIKDEATSYSVILSITL